MMRPAIITAAVLALTLFSMDVSALDGGAIRLTSSQVRALELAIKKAKRESYKIHLCKVVIREDKVKIEIAFLDEGVANINQVGSTSKFCDFAYEVDKSGKKVLRKYFYR